MPWQRLVADVAGEIDPGTGVLAYRTVWVTVMRQNGKTTLIFSIELDRCVAWEAPQRVGYSAQTGFEAKKKLLEDQLPLIERSPLAPLITKQHGGKVRRAQGDWGIDFGGPTGGKIDVITGSEAAGHGGAIDLAVLDEAWKDVDDRREQAMVPAMATRPWAQLWGVSTQGTDESIYLAQQITAGRAAVEADAGHGIAYFEWSIPADADIDDPAIWWAHMPALGWTITEAVVVDARQRMTDAGFRRAFGNQRQQGEERLIPPEVWDAVQDPTAAPEGAAVFGLDMSAESGAWSIAASDGAAVEVIDTGDSKPVAWFEEREERRWWPVVIDGSGPATAIVDDLEDLGVRVVRIKRAEFADCCARFRRRIADREIAVRPTSPGLDAAVAEAAKQPVGERWCWSRTSGSVDPTPLFAATLAAESPERPSVYEERGLSTI